MKLQNIFALIVTLIGFAACTSESELPDTPVSGDLVPVTISLGSIQTKAGVGLDTDEDAIQNAVIGIFDSKGIPTVAPIVLNNMSTGTTRLPLIKSRAYAFVNVSDADIEALKTKSNADDFMGYEITKALTQDASELPKFGMLEEFTPEKDKSFTIPVNQMTARLDVNVSVELTENGQPVTASFVKETLQWAGIAAEATTTNGNDGDFTTTINKITYDNVINRTYSYPGATPTLTLSGKVGDQNKSFSYTFAQGLKADNVYLLNVTIKGDISKPSTVIFDYQLVSMETLKVDVPAFE